MPTKHATVAIVIPNWNGLEGLADCLHSLLKQSYAADVLLVDNGSTDLSVAMVEKQFPEVTIIQLNKNYGFAGGVNAGIKKSLEAKYAYTALFNNDAVADPDWLARLVAALEADQDCGMATCSFISMDKSHYDSTGDQYTIWGLPYPRGRGRPVDHSFDSQTDVFGVSGGASLYRNALFRRIGLFDEDFFAYYEDVDISWRARLAGFTATFVPEAIAYHQIGGTSSKMKGFTTYQSFKNMPLVVYKNIPKGLLWRVVPRFCLAYAAFGVTALKRRHGWHALRGWLAFLRLIPKKRRERSYIQTHSILSDVQVWTLLDHDLPPDQHKLRRLRAFWWQLLLRHPETVPPNQPESVTETSEDSGDTPEAPKPTTSVEPPAADNRQKVKPTNSSSLARKPLRFRSAGHLHKRGKS